MAHQKKRMPGPQHHAEGQHGEKTHRRFIEQLQQTAVEGKLKTGSAAPPPAPRRRHEDRQQHDEAEKNSEKA